PLQRPPHPPAAPFPYTTLFRSNQGTGGSGSQQGQGGNKGLGASATQMGQQIRDLGNQVRDQATERYEQLRDQAQEYYNTGRQRADRKSTRLNSSHVAISYAVFC